MLIEHAGLLLALACLFGFFMAWGVGANHVANAMGTSVGSRALTVKQAILIAIVFEFSGAWLAGGEVTSTIRKGIVDAELLADVPEQLIAGMLAALLAAGTWLLIATRRGWPVSTTHSIVGAIVGFAAVSVGMEAIHWTKVGQVAASWVISPVLSGSFAFVLYRFAQRGILEQDNPVAAARKRIPYFMFLVGFILALVTLLKGLKHVGLEVSLQQSLIYAVCIGITVMMVGHVALARPVLGDQAQDISGVERLFAILMIFTACAMAFAHGSNDVANAIGPVAAIVGLLESGNVASKTAVPPWLLLLGAVGIVVGLSTYGYKVMATVGERITELTPSRGFAAELAAATTVVLASATGIPVSTTHTLIGGILGVGLAMGAEKLNTRMIGTIVISWVITLPVGAGLAVLFYSLFMWSFGLL